MVLVLLVGCANTQDKSGAAPDMAGNSIEGDGAGDMEKSISVAAGTPYADSVVLTVVPNKSAYTVQEVIRIDVKVENKAETALAYHLGSGSDLVPNAVQFYLHGMVPMFISEDDTGSENVQILKPGQVRFFELTFAPYTANRVDLWPGKQTDLSLFENTADYTVMEPGTYECEVRFVYVILPPAVEDASLEYEQAEKHWQTTTVAVVLE
jgi:hypothetical protein